MKRQLNKERISCMRIKRSKADEMIARLEWMLKAWTDLSSNVHKTKGLDKNPDPLFIILR